MTYSSYQDRNSQCENNNVLRLLYYQKEISDTDEIASLYGNINLVAILLMLECVEGVFVW